MAQPDDGMATRPPTGPQSTLERAAAHRAAARHAVMGLFAERSGTWLGALEIRGLIQRREPVSLGFLREILTGLVREGQLDTQVWEVTEGRVWRRWWRLRDRPDARPPAGP